MNSINKHVFKSLKDIRQEIDRLTAGDKDGIAKIGAAIEQLLTENEADTISFSEVLILCLSALQKIYQDETENFPAFITAISASFIAAEQMVASPENEICDAMLTHAGEALQTLLSGAGKVAAESNSVDSTDVSANDSFVAATLDDLNDVCSLFVQIGSQDTDDISRICDALKQITMRTENVEQRKVMVKAGRDLGRILKGKAADADELFDKVGAMLAAIQTAEENLAAIEATVNSLPEQPENTRHIDGDLSALDEEFESQFEETAPPKAEFKLELVANDAPVAESFEQESEQQPEQMVLPDDTSLLNEFITESRELIEAAEGSLLSLENNPEDIESINTVFRAFHSIKGVSAFLNLTAMTSFAHLAESLLSRMRDREIRCTGGYANLALRSADVIKELLSSIEQGMISGKPISLPADYAGLIKLLKDPEAHGISAETTAQTVSSEKIVDNVETGEKRTAVSAAAESSVRVRTDRLDSLIDMVGELVIAQSMLAQDGTVSQGLHPELSRKISHTGKIVRELQDLSMAMRMIPLKNTFQKMARIVRDVAQKCGKQIEFMTVGEDTEIDRNMVDFIADPLVHMVRNAADHGIETPEVRRENGKSATGCVKLAAYHAGGDVVVELTDDGAGLDRDRLVAKAVAQDLIESDKGMSDSQIYNLIFAPGFSTAEQITDVSGRGVGMDVVRRNIEAMRGRIEISSEKGKGSKFTIRLPLTLAITDGMLVRVGVERFIVPTVNIHLSFRPSAKMLSSVAGRGELVSLRGELMPVFRLHKLFEVENAFENPTEALLMIIADGNRRCALMVDELLGQQQVVAKTLGQGVGKIHGVSGGAILGDGCVGLILDLAEIVALARQSASAADRRENAVQKIAV